MKTRKTLKKKSLKRPAQESDESETENFANENESGNNEQHFTSPTSSHAVVKRRKIPTKDADDSVEFTELGGFSSTEMKSPEKACDVMSSELISNVQMDLEGATDLAKSSNTLDTPEFNAAQIPPKDPDDSAEFTELGGFSTPEKKSPEQGCDVMSSKLISNVQVDLAADLAESSNTLDTPEFNAAPEYATDPDHETKTDNLEQENTQPEETDVILSFPELSFEFEEHSEPFNIPEGMQDSTLSTPEMPFNYEDNFECSYRNEIDSEHDEEYEVGYNSPQYDYELDDDQEWEYFPEGSGFEKEDEYAEFEDDTGVEQDLGVNEFSGEYFEEPNPQYEEDYEGEEEQELSQSEYLPGDSGFEKEDEYAEYEDDTGVDPNVRINEFTGEDFEEPTPQYEEDDGGEEEDEYAEFEDDTGVEQDVGVNEFSGEDFEEPIPQYEEDDGGEEEQESLQSEDGSQESVSEATNDDSEESQSEEEVDEEETGQSGDEESVSEEEDGDISETEGNESERDVESASEEETEQEESENDESAAETESDEDQDEDEDEEGEEGEEGEEEEEDEEEEEEYEEEDEEEYEEEDEEEYEEEDEDTQKNEQPQLELVDDLQFNNENFEETKSEYRKEVEVEESVEKLFTELSLEDSSKDISKESKTELLAELREDSCNERTDKLHVEVSADKVSDKGADIQSKDSQKVLSPTKKANVKTDDPKSTPKIIEEPSQIKNLQPKEPLSYIAEAMQPTQNQPKVVREQPHSPARSQKSGKKESKLSEKKKSKKKKTKEEDNSSSSNHGNLGSPLSVLANKKKLDKISFLTKMQQKTTEKEEKPKAGPDTGPSVASVKETEGSKVLKTEHTSGKDFFEDESSYEEGKVNSDDDEEDIRPKVTSENSFVVVLSDYELLFQEIRKLIERVPNRFKYEIHTMLFPILAITYLHMISNGKYRKGKTFVDNSVRYLDHSYTSRVDKLIVLQSSGDLSKKARKLLSDEKEQLSISMFGDTYRLLLLHIQTLSPALQLIFIRHFNLVPEYNITEPRQHNIVGSPMPDKILWANPEALKEKKENSPPSRRKRSKNFKPGPGISLARNGNLPTSTRLYTPTLKRWDLEQLREDEERRVPLDRESLPSAYLYTAIECVETVICAIFSNNTTMLCIGTNSSIIHIFSLTSAKLAQLKPATFLKNLDTTMSGIDDSMLDASNKKMRRTLIGHQGPVYGCAFAPNDRFLLSCSHDRTVRCWCLLSWSCVVIYPGHSSAVYGVCYAPLGYYFATVSDDRTARVWMQDSKKSLCILVGHLAEVICCIFNPNRHYLATGSADCTVRMWDIIKAVQVRVFSGHREPVNTLAYSICGRYLVSGADDNYIIVWDTDKEQMVRWLCHHTDAVNCLQFGMDNKVFVAGGQDCELSIWDFERIIQEYDMELLKLENDKETKRGRQRMNCSKGDPSAVLIKSYASKETPFYMLHITRRNLVLGFCVQRMEDAATQSKESAQAEAKYREWLEFLDILKLKACCEPMAMEQSETKLEEAVEPETAEVVGSKVEEDQDADQALQSSINELFAE